MATDAKSRKELRSPFTGEPKSASPKDAARFGGGEGVSTPLPPSETLRVSTPPQGGSERKPARGEENRVFAQHMRHHPTPWELKLWYQLKAKRLGGYRFRRQQQIDHYIVDFINLERRVIIELDGSQHAQNVKDQARDAYLTQQNFQVLRFWNNEIDTNLEGVLAHILSALSRSPHASPFGEAQGEAP